MSILSKYQQVSDLHDRIRSAKLGRDPFSVCFDAIHDATQAEIAGETVILLGSNNYLGLTFDRSCIEMAAAALRGSGTGTTGSRVANGSYQGHTELEERLKAFYGARHAMVFTTGYQANLGIISTLAGRDDHLLLDADSHASIYDAAKLSAAQVIRFRHNDPEDLARRLRRLRGQPGDRLVVVEGIYSMFGDTAPLVEIAAVVRAAGAYLLVDEAHSLGVLGQHGRGLTEATGVKADFIVGTFSKSLGAVGGFCVSDIDDFETLRVACRPYMFTASLPPSVVASVTEALKQMETRPDLRSRLHANGSRLYQGLEKAGFALGPEAGPIVSVRLPAVETAIDLWNGVLDNGVYCNLALPPATPTGEPLLRASVSAAHTSEQVDQAIEAITEQGKLLGLVGSERVAAE
ncbi:MAG TPA: pyridoxal phosphate-dependent aminotransferase family protein [Alphaproteobacteria bacterium]|nr:pyridoxal phosphate-dependent aminotransferase family protein [Alphaproteobacteria bacterium]